MKAVVSVIGQDMTGIIARVSAILYENNINILDISQSVMQEIFSMVMTVDISESKVPLDTLVDRLDKLGGEMGIAIRAMHQNIFNAMHRI